MEVCTNDDRGVAYESVCEDSWVNDNASAWDNYKVGEMRIYVRICCVNLFRIGQRFSETQLCFIRGSKEPIG